MSESVTVASHHELKRHAKLGMIALVLRSILQNVVIIVANVYLARRLDPGDYGIFAILQFALSFFRLLADTGLGTALVQQEKTPDDIELSTIWWFQIGLGVLMVLGSFAAVPLLPKIWPALTGQLAWLLPALSLTLLFSMVQAVPFLILEREVKFKRVGTLEFLGTAMFYGSAVVLAMAGKGAAALVWASVGQAAIVAILATIVQPWRPKFVFQPRRLKHLLKFGLSYQGSNAINFVNNAVPPLVVGAKLGKAALGIIQFSESVAFFPSLLVGIVRRVYFPYLCRLQNDKKAFVREFEEAVVLCAIPTFFFFGLFLGTAPAIVEIVYGAKWLSAAPAIRVYALGFAFTFFSWIGDAVLAALNDMPKLVVMRTVGTLISWVFTVIAVSITPTPMSFAWGYLVHMVIMPTMIYFGVRKLIPEVRVFRRIWAFVVAALVIGGIGHAVLMKLTNPFLLIGWTVSALLLFFAITLGLDANARRVAKKMYGRYRNRQTPLVPE